MKVATVNVKGRGEFYSEVTLSPPKETLQEAMPKDVNPDSIDWYSMRVVCGPIQNLKSQSRQATEG